MTASISGRTRLLGLIGHPVEHSLSPAIHNAGFAAEGLDYVYVALDVRPQDVPSAVRGAAALGFRGFNVTMPHKRAVIPLLDEIDDAARLSEAVNTVVIEDFRLHGHSTDGAGFVQACGEAGVALAGRRVALLGAGGVSAPIALALDAEGIARLRVVNRTRARADALVGKLRSAGTRADVEAEPYETLAEVLAEAEVIVNATSLGMSDSDPLPVPVSCLDASRAICDAVYRPDGETALVREARRRGAAVVGGKRMLLHQGVEAHRLFTGREPNVQAMSDALG